MTQSQTPEPTALMIGNPMDGFEVHLFATQDEAFAFADTCEYWWIIQVTDHRVTHQTNAENIDGVLTVWCSCGWTTTAVNVGAVPAIEAAHLEHRA